MKLTLLANDGELFRAFEGSSFFREVIRLDNIEGQDLATIETDVLVVSDGLLDVNNLSSCRREANQKIFYLVSNKKDEEQIKAIRAVCDSYDIVTVPNKLVTKQIVEYVERTLFPKAYEKKKVAVFLGADSKVGTTMISQSVAETIARNSNLKVGFFVLADKKNNNYMEEANSIDAVKGEIKSDLLTRDHISEIMLQKDNLYFLSGVSNLLGIRDYKPENIEPFISLASELFDVVIIDAGSNLDNGLSLAALKYTNNIFMVTSQAPASKNQFAVISSIMNNLMFKQESFMLIINKYIDNKSLFSSAKEIADYYKMLLAGTVSYIGLGHESLLPELEKKTFNDFAIKDFEREISHVSRIVANRLDIKVDLAEIKEKKSFFSKFGGR